MPSAVQITMEVKEWSLSSNDLELRGVVVFDLNKIFDDGAYVKLTLRSPPVDYGKYYICKTYSNNILLRKQTRL